MPQLNFMHSNNNRMHSKISKDRLLSKTEYAKLTIDFQGLRNMLQGLDTSFETAQEIVQEERVLKPPQRYSPTQLFGTAEAKREQKLARSVCLL